jgi:hypothetical protein
VKKKWCIVGLISLFVWNALMGAFGGLLLCIHEDLGLHVDCNTELEAACAPEEEACGADACLSSNKPCVDIEVVAEQLPIARIKSDDGCKQLQGSPEIAMLAPLWIAELPVRRLNKKIAVRAPPQSCWLTDLHLQTTVLRV